MNDPAVRIVLTGLAAISFGLALQVMTTGWWNDVGSFLCYFGAGRILIGLYFGRWRDADG